MNKNIKRQLKTAFEPPAPAKKEKFLALFPEPKLSFTQFILAQFRYIRIRAWIVMAVLLLLAAVCCYGNDISVWVVAAALPFFSLVVLNELSKSDIFKMGELEASCRYNLPNLILSRTVVLGITSFVFLAAIQLLLFSKSGVPFISFCLFFNTPMTLSSFLTLLIINRLNCDITLASASVSGVICIIGMVVFNLEYFMSLEYNIFWATIFVLSISGVIAELIKLIRRTEESKWSLQSAA